MKRYYVVFTGQVQGVGFRWTLQRIAISQNITGWVRNMSNDNVEAQLQGENLDFNQLYHKLANDNRWIIIDDYSIQEIPVVPDEKKFRVVF